MTESTKDTGVLLTLLQRFETQRLPRVLELKEKVDGGNCLGDHDIEFMQQLIADANQIKPILDKHPEYNKLVAQVFQLYNEITAKGLENEQKA